MMPEIERFVWAWLTTLNMFFVVAVMTDPNSSQWLVPINFAASVVSLWLLSRVKS